MSGRVFDHIEEMLDPAVLASVVGSPVTSVVREVLETEGFSDNLFERISCENANGDTIGLVLKRFVQNDWIAALTSDSMIREIALLEEGWYGRLPLGCEAPMLAATRGASGASILMRDVSRDLFPPGDEKISEGDLNLCLRGVAALHADNWGGRSPEGAIDFCTTDAFIGLLAPDVGRRRIELGVDNGITASLELGWETFSHAASTSAAQIVGRIRDDDASLLDALEAAPQSLVHGDLKLANLGIDQFQRLVMLDWALVGSMSPFLDLGWFLAVNSARLPVPKESILEAYQGMLLERGIDLGADWTRHVEIGLLGGGALRLGWVKALGTLSDDETVRVREAEELEWWSDMTERASRWLS